MQEQQKLSIEEIIKLSHPLCSKKNKATFFCFNNQCKNYPLICGLKDCQCLSKQHINCDFTFMNSFIQKIVNKKSFFNQETKKIFQAIDKILMESIQKLSDYRQSLFLWKQNYGLTLEEIKFVQAIRNNTLQKIDGHYISELKKNLEQSSQHIQPSSVTLKEIENIWQKQSKMFQTAFRKLMESIQIFGDSKTQRKFYFNINLSSKAGKQVTYNTKNQIYERSQSNLGVIQLTSVEPLPKKGKIYFDTQFVESKGGYFATGIVTKKIKDQDQAFSNKESIKYFGHGNVWVNGDGQGNHQKIKDGQILRTIIDNSNHTIEWFSNDKLLRKIEMIEAFYGSQLYVSYQLGSYTGIKFKKL